jgi:hypothetical protein
VASEVVSRCSFGPLSDLPLTAVEDCRREMPRFRQYLDERLTSQSSGQAADPSQVAELILSEYRRINNRQSRRPPAGDSWDVVGMVLPHAVVVKAMGTKIEWFKYRRAASSVHLAGETSASRPGGASMTSLTGIKTLTICCSSKFYDTAQALAKEMTDAGLNVFTPRFDFNEEVVAVTMADKISLTREFLRKIEESDAIYVIDQDGYSGRSVCIEIGYASALGKTVVLSESPAENAVRALTSAVVAVGEIAKRITP